MIEKLNRCWIQSFVSVDLNVIGLKEWINYSKTNERSTALLTYECRSNHILSFCIEIWSISNYSMLHETSSFYA